MSIPVSLETGKDIAGIIGAGLSFIGLVSLSLMSIVCIAMFLLMKEFTKYGLIAQSNIANNISRKVSYR